MKSQYFSRQEFACRCGCGGDTVDAALLQVLEDARDHFQRPIQVNSGFRCDAHNEKEGGWPDSEHLKGKAADIVVVGWSPSEVQAYFKSKYRSTYGIGSYRTFTHIDVRERKARWEG